MCSSSNQERAGVVEAPARAPGVVATPPYNKVLLASHGTEGAQAAEALAMALCAEGGTVHHLLVVPMLWQGMMGDDWLNNVATRIRYGDYLEGQLTREAQEHFTRVVESAAVSALECVSELRQGEPFECLLALQRETGCEAVVIGAPRPKGTEGLRSRMRLDDLLRALPVPLIVAPHPGA